VMDSREIVFGIAMVVQEIKNPLPERVLWGEMLLGI